MYGDIKNYLQDENKVLRDAGLYKEERIITSPQEILNFCGISYLGLSNHPEDVKADKDAMDTHGFGMSSVRFICGTQDIHKKLEQKISNP